MNFADFVFFENRKVVEFDELPKSKRDRLQSFPFVCVHYMTQIPTTIKGFDRSLLVSENQLGENYEKTLKKIESDIRA